MVLADNRADEGVITEGVRTVKANGLELAYETFGNEGDPAILLVMGLGAQMIAWSDEMCATLAAAGVYVVRFDNRDVGLSTHLSVAAPSTKDLVLKRRAPYSIGDMAQDAKCLLDALDIDAAHVMGVSMGGFISQTMALEHPKRVRSLTLVMTSTGSRRVGKPSAKVLRHMATRTPVHTREEAVTEALVSARLIGSSEHFDEQAVADLSRRSFDRSWDPHGMQRQLAAIMSQPNRTADLADITVPTVVIHGLRDGLVSHSGGIALARAIPGSRFVGQHGLGHDLPRTFWREIADEAATVISRSQS